MEAILNLKAVGAVFSDDCANETIYSNGKDWELHLTTIGKTTD